MTKSLVGVITIAMKTPAVSLVLIALILSGCVSTRSQHGYVVEFGETGLEAEPGIDSKESVLARFGEPSVRPALDDDVWYYITQKTNARAFFQTEVYERDIVAFHFNDRGLVEEVKHLDLADGTDVDLVNRVTATKGKELSLWEQLLGGVGVAAAPVPGGQPGSQDIP
ncbi:MAG: outer membrane protein assembly factor BamE [Parvularcula sp.]|nr:outer membrane protein assembly factor BamE [Parvularcula sp.]